MGEPPRVLQKNLSDVGLLDNLNYLKNLRAQGLQYKLGGDFKQYSAPSHEAGGQLSDANGNPTANMP